MIDAVTVQAERTGATQRPSALTPASARSHDPAREERDGDALRESPRAGAPAAQNGPTANRVPPAGLIDKQGLLSAQTEQTEEERERGADPQNLTEEERAQVQELKARDREVRAHERAHASAGGQYAGSPSYTYETGPDGKRYAVGGEVSIDSGPVAGDPEATIRKAEQIKKAALAPADPSGQDRAVAAQAEALKAQARAELTQQRAEERREASAEDDEDAASGPGSAESDQGPLAVARARVEEARSVSSETPGSGPRDDPLQAEQGSKDPRQPRGEVSRARLDEALTAYRSGRSVEPRAHAGFEGAADAAHVLNLVA